MAKVTITRCDVKPCNLKADRMIEVNGKAVWICGEGCFIRFWGREHQQWKQLGYQMRTSFIPSIKSRAS